jgi:hypothetical protein
MFAKFSWMPGEGQYKILLQYIIVAVDNSIIGGSVDQAGVLMQDVEGGELDLACLILEKAITGAGIPQGKRLPGGCCTCIDRIG